MNKLLAAMVGAFLACGLLLGGCTEESRHQLADQTINGALVQAGFKDAQVHTQDMTADVKVDGYPVKLKYENGGLRVVKICNTDPSKLFKADEPVVATNAAISAALSQDPTRFGCKKQ